MEEKRRKEMEEQQKKDEEERSAKRAELQKRQGDRRPRDEVSSPIYYDSLEKLRCCLANVSATVWLLPTS